MNLTLTNDSGDLQINFENYRKLINPCGMIVNFSGDNAPNGWLICDGREISKTTYSDLFDVIGTKYGSASNSNNFKLPDLGERIPSGFKSGTNSLGNTGGNSSITLTTGQLPSHTHTGTIASDGSHTHTGTSDSNGLHSHTITDPGHTHSQTTVNDDFNNSGTSPPGFSADSAGSRTWNNISNAYTGISINQDGAHTHTFTTASNGSHSHSISISNSGNGESIDIRNKFIVLNYIIKY
jgi:microcystin-dependent protein